MPGGGPVLLGMPDIELLCIMKIMCEVVGDQQADRKFNSQTIKLSSTQSCKPNTDWEIKSDNEDVFTFNPNVPNYFRSSTGREADKRENLALTQRIHSEFSDVFSGRHT